MNKLNFYTGFLQACDSGNPRMCANATITLNVEDVNDEAPQFDLPVYQVDIFDDYASGTTLLQPVAIDRDSGTNAVISYSLQVWLTKSCRIILPTVYRYVLVCTHPRKPKGGVTSTCLRLQVPYMALFDV